MSRTCSIREVARQAKVSPGTVSRVLNNRLGEMNIPEETRRMIAATAQRLNYTPNVNARRLFSRRAGVIGLVVPSYARLGTHIFENYHVTRIITGLEKGLTGKKYRLLLVFNDDDFVRERQYLSLFRERNVDGLLIWGAYENETYWNQLAEEKFPHLFLSNVPSGGERLNYIVSDNETAGYRIAAHLLEQGHRRLAWISGKSGISVSCHLENGIRHALREYGLDWNDVQCEHGDFLTASGEAATERLLRNQTGFTALMTANYDMALGAVTALQHSGYTASGQVTVAACDSYRGQDDGRLDLPRIETRDLEIGEAAAIGIQTLIETPERKIQVRYEVDFLSGKSPLSLSQTHLK